MNLILSLLLIAALPAKPEPLLLEAEISAPAPEVWRALTTEEGVETFFAQDARVESRIGGAYEMYFLPENAPGLRGSEGTRILAMEAPHRLLISWNAPLSFGPLRDQQTVVEFELIPRGEDRTLVHLTHDGWGRGSNWNGVRDYFSVAWQVVLGRLQYRFEEGPVDWTQPVDGRSYFRTAVNPAATSPEPQRNG